MICAPVSRSAIVIALLLAGGCSSPQPRYYTLATTQGAEKTEMPSSSGAAYAVAVGPVSLPAVVDRPQIVIQVAPSRVVLLDDQRWAEPLNSSIPRAIASDLAKLLGVSVVIFPQDSLSEVKYRVAIEIRNFISVPGEAATVEAAWTIYGPHDSVKRGLSVASEPTKEAGYDALAAAHGRALMKVSRDVAAAIQSAESGG